MAEQTIDKLQIELQCGGHPHSGADRRLRCAGQIVLVLPVRYSHVRCKLFDRQGKCFPPLFHKTYSISITIKIFRVCKVERRYPYNNYF